MLAYGAAMGGTWEMAGGSSLGVQLASPWALLAASSTSGISENTDLMITIYFISRDWDLQVCCHDAQQALAHEERK